MKNSAKVTLMLVLLLSIMNTTAVWAEGPKYPPLNEYLMVQEAEVALARSAAPEKISARATVKILTASGYKVATQGDNGFVCMVLLRAPHCFDPVASRTVLPLQELQAELGLKGKGSDQIAEAVQAAYSQDKMKGERND